MSPSFSGTLLAAKVMRIRGGLVCRLNGGLVRRPEDCILLIYYASMTMRTVDLASTIP